MKIGEVIGVIENEPEDIIRELPVQKKKEKKEVKAKEKQRKPEMKPVFGMA